MQSHQHLYQLSKRLKNIKDHKKEHRLLLRMSSILSSTKFSISPKISENVHLKVEVPSTNTSLLSFNFEELDVSLMLPTYTTGKHSTPTTSCLLIRIATLTLPDNISRIYYVPNIVLMFSNALPNLLIDSGFILFNQTQWIEKCNLLFLL